MATLDKFKVLKVLVGIPTHGTWHGYFGRDLQQLVAAFSKYRVGEYKDQELYLHYVRGSILTKSRLDCLREARRMDVDYLFFVDTDQTFPRKTLHMLINRRKDVVAANIATKQIPSSPTARLKGPGGLKDWKPVYTDPESSGLQQVDRVGTGLILLSRHAYRALPYSCFDMRYRADIDEVQGEDWSMCEALEQLGIDIWVDHDLSKEVGHVGDYEYRHEVVGELVSIEEGSDELEFRNAGVRKVQVCG